jgi:hypothetical protein
LPVGEIAGGGLENGYAALVAPILGHRDETSRRNGAITGASAAVAEFGRVGCFGASQSFGLRRQASWLKVWRGGGCNFNATERAHKRSRGRVSRNAGGEVWSRLWFCNKIEDLVLKNECHSQRVNFTYRHIPAFDSSNAEVTSSLCPCRRFARCMVMAE